MIYLVLTNASAGVLVPLRQLFDYSSGSHNQSGVLPINQTLLSDHLNMFSGFERIIEERIRQAQQKGKFENLAGSGKPLRFEDDGHVAEELRLAYKILKNADCLPPEIELKKEIDSTEDLLSGMKDTAEKYHTLKKLNFLIMKLNSLGKKSVQFDMPQKYSAKLVERFEDSKKNKRKG